ncbi:MAG: hypothetical protein K2Y71_10270 [Xanthobacteraceae bacterium]|nr:hypothetical protein [Xanthobacteraceae bacterium]
MQIYVLLAACGAFLVFLFAWRVTQLKRRHNMTAIDPTPEILGPKEVHRHRL